MISLLLALQLATALPAGANTAPPAVTIVVERLPAYRPHVVTNQHIRTLGPGAFLDSILSRLAANGFFQLSSNAIADACGHPGATVNRFTILVHDETGSRQLELPDECQPSSQSLGGQLAKLRNIAWDALAGKSTCVGVRRPSRCG